MSEVNKDYDEWQCPKCGWDSSNDSDYENMISQTKPEFNMAIAINAGGDPYDWTETWRCPDCGEVFEIERECE